jgi:hypothetical protein
MTDWAQSIVDRLSVNANLLSLVGQVGSEPSIWLEDDATPESVDYGANGPVVVVRQAPIGQIEIGRETVFGGLQGTWRLTFQIRCYGVETASVHDVARAVAGALGGWKSGDVEGCEVSFPVAAPTSTPVVVGRILTAELTVKEN